MNRVEIIVPPTAINTGIAQHLFWIKKTGDRIEEGDSVASIEASKGLSFIQAPAAGILDEIVIPKGTVVKVNQTIGYVRVD